MEFITLGHTDQIGASCHLLKAEETGILLDTGVHPDIDGPEGLPRFDVLRNRPDLFVDHIVMSHAHHDHLGALPVALQRFPHAVVHFTKPTRELAEFLLRASARLQRRRIREGSSTAEPLFSEEELEYYSYLYLAHDLETPFSVAGVRGGAPVRATFYHAGHVLGSAGTLFEFEEAGVPKRVFFTGDILLRPQVLTPAADLPDAPIDVLIMEATLGADTGAEETTRKAEEERFAEHIGRTLAGGGAVLVPVFALGRAQEMLTLIGRLKERGVIPPTTPVYTAGSMRAIAEIYDKTRLTSPRLDPEIQIFGIDQKRLPRGENALVAALREPSIFVLPSGMMFERTMSNEVAQYLVDQEKNAVLLVGFAKPGSPSDLLLQAAKEPGTEVVIDKMTGPQPVWCSVERFRFSGHSHRRDLLGMVTKLRPKKVVLVHGEPAAKEWMRDNILHFHPEIEVFLPETGVPLVL